MLDTNTVSALVRAPAGAVARRIAQAETTLSISIIVTAELRYGAAKKASPRLSASIDALLGSIDIEPLHAPADLIYGRLRVDLERRGDPLSANDLLIAVHALSLDRVLVTHVAAFSRVPDLRVEDWLVA